MLHSFKKCTSLALAIMLFGALSGCTDRVSLAEAEMKKIRDLPAKPIEPPPTPKAIEDYDYVANNMRSPFVPQSLLDRQATIANMPSIRPDNNRVKHELEKYALSSLIYRGKVVAPNGREYGLVQAPDGVVRDVQIGDYMGENHGRIVEITPTQINLIEIIEDARLGYVERSANLITPN